MFFRCPRGTYFCDKSTPSETKEKIQYYFHQQISANYDICRGGASAPPEKAHKINGRVLRPSPTVCWKEYINSKKHNVFSSRCYACEMLTKTSFGHFIIHHNFQLSIFNFPLKKGNLSRLSFLLADMVCHSERSEESHINIEILRLA